MTKEEIQNIINAKFSTCPANSIVMIQVPVEKMREVSENISLFEDIFRERRISPMVCPDTYKITVIPAGQHIEMTGQDIEVEDGSV